MYTRVTTVSAPVRKLSYGMKSHLPQLKRPWKKNYKERKKRWRRRFRSPTKILAEPIKTMGNLWQSQRKQEQSKRDSFQKQDTEPPKSSLDLHKCMTRIFNTRTSHGEIEHRKKSLERRKAPFFHMNATEVGTRKKKTNSVRTTTWLALSTQPLDIEVPC